MNHTLSIETTEDVIGLLTAQHQQIKALFAKVLMASGEAREQAFAELRQLLAVHETAEEEVVHPRARHELADGEQIVGQRLDEEREAKEVLTVLEGLDVTSAEFESKLRAFQTNVVEHAEAEEKLEFAQLADALDDDQLRRMRKAVKLAEAIAPTHPHAGVESQAANAIAGPFAAMVDRARDLISGRP